MATSDQFREAEARAEVRRRKGPLATRARYDRRAKRIIVELDSGLELSFPPQKAEGLERAQPGDLLDIEITPSGLGLHFPGLDADLYLPALLDGLMGSRKWMAKRLGEAGGRARSAAKAVASRENGRLGGRPVRRAADANPRKGEKYRTGAARDRSQVFNPKTEDWTKRDADTGRFMDRKSDDKRFKSMDVKSVRKKK
jgi:hypothetical protein